MIICSYQNVVRWILNFICQRNRIILINLTNLNLLNILYKHKIKIIKLKISKTLIILIKKLIKLAIIIKSWIANQTLKINHYLH
jgi:hypothetical protein